MAETITPEQRAPIVHDLKIWPEYFQPVADGAKRFELRKADRDYRVGDTLRLREWVRTGHFYSGREVDATVTYVLRGDNYFLPSDMVALSIRTPTTEAAHDR